MKNFDEWCESNGIDKSSLKDMQLSMAFQIWGNWCYQEGKKLEEANKELKARLKRAEKAVYIAAKDEIEALYHVKTMEKRTYDGKIEEYMFDLLCRADKELTEERNGNVHKQ